MSESIKLRWIKFSPDEFIAGIAAKLDPVDAGVYWMICSLIYSHGGPIEDDHERISGLFRKTHWRVIRASIERLKVAGKITIEDGKLWVKRCERELQRGGKSAAEASQEGRKRAARRSQDAPTLAKNNDLEKQNQELEPSTINHQPSTTAECPPAAGPSGFDPRYGSVCSKVEELVSTVTTFPFARNRVQAWLESGADPDMDIYPTIEARKTRWKGRSLEYFDDGIASSIASRTKPLPAGEAKPGKFDPAAFIRANFDENGKPKAKVAE